MQTITIPKKCKAGFQTRNDTYSGKLAMVVNMSNCFRNNKNKERR